MKVSSIILLVLLLAVGFVGFYYYNVFNAERQRIANNNMPLATIHVRAINPQGIQTASAVYMFNGSGQNINYFYTNSSGYVVVGVAYGWVSGSTYRFDAMTADMSLVGSQTVTLGNGDNYVTIQLQVTHGGA